MVEKGGGTRKVTKEEGGGEREVEGRRCRKEMEEWAAGQKQLETHALRGSRRHFVRIRVSGLDLGLKISF